MLPHLPDIRNKNQRCANIDNDKKCQYSSGTLTSEESNKYEEKRHTDSVIPHEYTEWTSKQKFR